MKIIIFHRKQVQEQRRAKEPQKQTDQNGKSPTRDPYLRERSATINGLSKFEYVVKDKSDSLSLTIEALEHSKTPVKGTVSIPLVPWTRYNIYYLPSAGKFTIIDRMVINPVGGSVGFTTENYVGRVITTDTEALVYLRGRFQKINGFKNILLEDGQTSSSAFSRYSSKVKHFVENSEMRKAALSRIDVFKQLAYLEAQVDLLTKILLDSKIVKNEGLKGLIQEALSLSSLKGKSNEEIRKRIQYKKFVQSTKAF